jgi:pheromone shutdown protein TraB
MAQENNNEMIHRLTVGDKEVILIGTAHVSKDSAELVKSVIRHSGMQNRGR